MLYNILRSKGNNTMKFGQLIESNINIFLEKKCAKYGGKASPNPFIKNRN